MNPRAMHFHAKLPRTELKLAPPTSFLAVPHLQPGEKRAACKMKTRWTFAPLAVLTMLFTPRSPFCPHQELPLISHFEPSQHSSSSFSFLLLCIPLLARSWPCSSVPGAGARGLLLAQGWFAQAESDL